MKEFISGLAILVLLLIFPLQSQVDTRNAYRINNLNETIFNSCEQARFDGRFTEKNIAETKNKISKIFNVGLEEVTFEGTTTPKYRTDMYDEREKIEYKFSVPLKNVFASENFLGLSAEENKQLIVKDGHVYSEQLYKEGLGL